MQEPESQRIHVGDMINIYYDPITCKSLEGPAMVEFIEHIQYHTPETGLTVVGVRFDAKWQPVARIVLTDER